MTNPTDKTETGPREGRTQRQIIWGSLILIVLAAGIGLVLTTHLSSPDGVYYNGSVSYLVFTNGEICVQGLVGRPPLAFYAQENGQWFFSDRNDTDREVITVTVLGITVHDAYGKGQDAFLFRRNFAWIPKTWTWL